MAMILRLLSTVFFKSLLLLLVILLQLGAVLWVVGYVPMVEAAICKRWYLDNNPSQIGRNEWVASPLCKIIEVQKEVAYIRGGQSQADAFMALALAFPYAWLERRIKTKVLVILACIGSLLQFIFVYGVCLRYIDLPIHLLWLSSSFLVIGGGTPMADLCIWSMLAVEVPEAKRSSIFFMISSTALVTQFLGTSLGAALLRSSPWLIFSVGIISTLIMILLLTCNVVWVRFRSKFIARPSASSSNSSYQPLVPDHDEILADDVEDELGRRSSDTLLGHPALLQPIEQPVADIASTSSEHLSPWQFIKHIHRQYFTQEVFLVYFLFLVCFVLAAEVALIVQQWVSVTFMWPLSSATMVVAYGMFVGFVVLTTLPAISSWLSGLIRWETSFDLLLVQLNVILLATRNFVMASSQRPDIFLVGFTIARTGHGCMDAERSFAASIVPVDGSITEMYTLRMVVQSVADMISGFMWAAIFTTQASLGGIWRGLPFLISGMLWLCCLLLTWRLKSLVRHNPQTRVVK